MSLTMTVCDKQSFVLGMELAMRIVRNRMKDIAIDGRSSVPNELETAVGVIRLVQVEIGSGRMPLPEPHEWTDEEIDEVERIS